jgi:hypothetical protein
MGAFRAALLLAIALPMTTAAQTRKPTPKPAPAKPAAPAAEPTREPARMVCPAELGVGVTSGRTFCDVMSGADPAAGILITLPPHSGPVTLSFDLHNRHTYSEDMAKANRAFARYTAVIGVLTMDNTLISRAAVQSEFRKVGDLVDRIKGGAGPGGVKAVAPTGTERVTIVIPEAEQDQVSLLGEKLTVERLDGSATYSSPGRPIAVVSDVVIEFRPPPPARKPPARKPKPGR